MVGMVGGLEPRVWNYGRVSRGGEPRVWMCY